MKITVTAEDIQMGRRMNGHFCPISLAAVRAGIKCAAVANDFIRSDATCEAWATPLAAKTFINAYDQGKPVAPFEFDLPGRY